MVYKDQKRKKAYRIYHGLKKRTDPEHKDYNGSKMCEEWLNNFSSFYQWLLDMNWDENLRPHHNTYYSPETCIFLTLEESKRLKTKATYLNKYGVESIGQLETAKAKREKTCLNKYGYKNPMGNNEVRNKIKVTCMERYGVDNAGWTACSQEKIKQTNLDKYGVEYSFQSEEVKQKIKETNLDRYGFESAMQNKDVKNRASESFMEKYGVKHALQHPEFIDKYKETCLERYGVEHAMKNEDIKNRCIQSIVEKYGSENVGQNQDIINKIRETRINNGTTRLIEGKTIPELSEEYGLSKSCIHKRLKYSDDFNFLTSNKKKTDIEFIVEQILLKYNLDYEYDKAINCFKPDFIVNNLIIECNGLYWHREEKAGKEYHKDKFDFYECNNYNSLFFWENEILNKTEIVESIILDRLNKNTTIKASDLEIKTGEKPFFTNHLLGVGYGKVLTLSDLFGVQYFIKNNTVFITRFCNKIGYTVENGLETILEYLKLKTNLPIVVKVNQRFEKPLNIEGTRKVNCETIEGFKLWNCGTIEYNL